MNEGQGNEMSEVSPSDSSGAPTTAWENLSPIGSLPTVRPGHTARGRRLRQEERREWETAERPERQRGCCVVLYSHPLALSFPAAALSCFPIRNGRAPQVQVRPLPPRRMGPRPRGGDGEGQGAPCSFRPQAFPREPADLLQEGQAGLVPSEIVLPTALSESQGSHWWPSRHPLRPVRPSCGPSATSAVCIWGTEQPLPQ